MMKERVSLKEYTTMKTGGNARYFFIAKNIDDIKEAVLCAKEKNLPFFVLGGGSNVLISDEEFDGVVIKMEMGGTTFENVAASTVRVTVGAGVEWDVLVGETVERGLYGLENLSLIPGTVGATPVQNIGAYGTEVKDVICWVEVFDSETLEIKKLNNEECVFGYRDSIFKKDEGKKFVVTRVAFDLARDGELKTNYKDVEEYFALRQTTPTLATVRSAVVEIRTGKLPDMNKMGTVGSFFKNPIVPEEKVQALLRTYPDLKHFPAGDGQVKLSAAWLLDHVGLWRGVCRGDACVYENQALVLVNRGNANTKEIVSLADEMRESIKEKTGVVLEFEAVTL